MQGLGLGFMQGFGLREQPEEPYSLVTRVPLRNAA